MRIKGRLARGFLIALVLSLMPVMAFSAQKVTAGSSCKVYKEKVTYQNKIYSCLKSGKKLVWSKGVLVATPKPTASPTQAKDMTALCKLKATDGRGDVSIGGWPRISDRMRTKGTVVTQVIFVDFPDAAATMTTQQAFAKVSMASDTFKEMSYGKFDYKLVPNYKWYRMKSSSSEYAPLNKSFNAHRAYIAEALSLADADIDFSSSDAFLILANPDAKGIGNSGPAFASVSGNGFTLDKKYIANGTTSAYDLNYWKSIWLNHEVTHTMGLVDFYAYVPSDSSNSGDGHRYVGQFSYMGLSSFESNAPGLTAYERWYLDWLDDSQVVCSSANEITQLITPLESAGGIKALMIPLSGTQSIVIESRRPIGIDSKLKKSGALVYLVDSTKQSGMGPVQIYPSDPKSDPLYLQAPRAVGEIVTIEGFTIKTLSSDSSGDTVSVKRN